MAKKAKKYITVLLTVLASAAMVTQTAFAAVNQTPSDTASSSAVSSALPSVGSSSTASSSSGVPSGSQASSNDGNGNVTPPSSNQGTDVSVTMDFNGGTGGATRLSVPRGTAVGDLATPTKKGSTFAGWTAGGNPVSASLKLTVDITLTAQWSAVAPSSSASQQAPSSSPAVSVDTHQSEVDAAASQADATISEPDTLSSQDWNDVFSSGSSSSSAAAGAVQNSQTSSGAAQSSGGGFSTLLAVGIGLIVLALAGIGLFIYLQFFRGRNSSRHGGPGAGPGPDSDTRATDNTVEFTDISSFSGKPERAHAPNPHDEFDHKPAHSRTVPETRPTRSDLDDTRVMPPRISNAPAPVHTPAQTPEAAAHHTTERAQAKPVSDAKSEFDWEKFFNEDK